MRGFLLGLACAVLVFVAFAVVARSWLHGPVAPGSLGVSVGSQHPEQSGGARYRVTTEPDGSCWTAERIQDYSEGPMPLRAHDCVRLWQWWALDVL
jgi:hypothetical protein